MIVKQPTEHHLEFLSLKRGCIGSSESTLVQMPHCWKSRHGLFHIDRSQLHVPGNHSVHYVSKGEPMAQW